MLRLRKLTLTNFRNYPRLVWSPEKPLIVLTGENGSGKTNILEAVSLLTTGRGIRRAPLQDLGFQQTPEWGISARLDLGLETVDLGTGMLAQTTSNRRVHFLNGRAVKQKNVLDELFTAVWVTPQMDRLFSENASGRRRFLDRLVMGINANHARELLAYDKSMAQRNKLLQIRQTETVWLAGLEASMARHAVAIAAARNDVVRHLCHSARTTQSEFPSTLIQLNCQLSERLEQASALETEDWLKTEFASRRREDKEKGRATLGSHRSDFSLADYQTGALATLASTGQQKAMLLGIVLAHATLVASYRGAPPLLLLDEPLVHLDQKKRAALLDHLSVFQTTVILTGTDAEPFGALSGTAQFSSLKNGRFIP